MRIWSLHPKYLDTKGLVAVWREGLLALHVLSGKTKGYTKHPQLLRFQNHPNPLQAITAYLHHIVDEAERRNFNFDRSKLQSRKAVGSIPVTSEQLVFELNHLLNKLRTRDPQKYAKLTELGARMPHPLFTVIPGPIEIWEKI